MSTIIQRVLNNSVSDDPTGITDAEKDQLMKELETLNKNYEEKKDGSK